MGMAPALGLPLAPAPVTAWLLAGSEGEDLSVPLAGVMPHTPSRSPQGEPALKPASPPLSAPGFRSSCPCKGSWHLTLTPMGFLPV